MIVKSPPHNFLNPLNTLTSLNRVIQLTLIISLFAHAFGFFIWKMNHSKLIVKPIYKVSSKHLTLRVQSGFLVKHPSFSAPHQVHRTDASIKPATAMPIAPSTLNPTSHSSSLPNPSNAPKTVKHIIALPKIIASTQLLEVTSAPSPTIKTTPLADTASSAPLSKANFAANPVSEKDTSSSKPTPPMPIQGVQLFSAPLPSMLSSAPVGYKPDSKIFRHPSTLPTNPALSHQPLATHQNAPASYTLQTAQREMESAVKMREAHVIWEWSHWWEQTIAQNTAMQSVHSARCQLHESVWRCIYDDIPSPATAPDSIALQNALHALNAVQGSEMIRFTLNTEGYWITQRDQTHHQTYENVSTASANISPSLPERHVNPTSLEPAPTTPDTIDKNLH
ncbi:MAG: hypothetical protein V4525_14215 [Pseudomonadota bacterium]